MLTPREQDTYTFIRQYLLRHGQAPLMREIAAALGIQSKSVIHRYLRSLEKKGLISLIAGHRGVELTDTQPVGRLPLLGRIAAGRPIEAIEGQDEVDLLEMLSGPNRFVLKVKGDSMVEAGILDGDMVIVEKRDQARNNEIVVALIDQHKATLKRLKKNKDGTLTLSPANARLSPMTYPADRVMIQGVVVGQLRAYR